MTEDAAKTVREKIWALASAGVQMTDKDVDVLGKIINSEPMLKALAIVASVANQAPSQLLAAKLSDETERANATQLQGKVFGIIQAIDTLLELATEKDESDDNDSTS